MMEQALPGLSSLSSAYASVRGDDGICRRDDRLQRAQAGCAAFTARPAAKETSVSVAKSTAVVAGSVSAQWTEHDPWTLPWTI